MISYSKIFNFVEENNIDVSILSNDMLDKLIDKKSVTTDDVNELCKALGCQPSDIMEYIPDADDVLLTSSVGSKTLSVTRCVQEQTKWCWVACTQSMLDYYGVSRT